MGLRDKVRQVSKKISLTSDTDGEAQEAAPDGEQSPASLEGAPSTQVLQQPTVSSAISCLKLDRLSRARFFTIITDPSRPLSLSALTDDSRSRLAQLCFNGMAVELRDLFRILDGLHERSEGGDLRLEHIFSFYDWFEGFYGIVCCIFDTEEDVLFSWLEKVGALRMENALAPKRRKTKKERTKDLCWDILELKMQFEKKAGSKVNLTSLILEMWDEAEQLTSRILMYLQNLLHELPVLLDENFGFDERRLVEEAVLNNFRASEPGKFVILAYSRGIVDQEKRNGFLEESFRTPKSTRNTVTKQSRRFGKKHTHLADELSVQPLVLEEVPALNFRSSRRENRSTSKG